MDIDSAALFSKLDIDRLNATALSSANALAVSCSSSIKKKCVGRVDLSMLWSAPTMLRDEVIGDVVDPAEGITKQ